MKKIFLLFLSITFVASFVACNQSTDLGYLYEDDDSGEPAPPLPDDRSNPPVPQYDYPYHYRAEGGDERLADIGRKYYPSIAAVESNSIGGTKLCAEMSADAAGISESRIPVGRELVLRDPIRLGLINVNVTQNVNVTNNVVWEIFHKNIEVDIGCICDNPDCDGPTANWCIPITFKNVTSRSIYFEIPEGTMFEAQRDDVQNVVVCQTISRTIAAHETIRVKLYVMCAAHYRDDPCGSRAKFTPFVLDAPHSAFHSQLDVWEYIANFKTN